MAIDQRQSDFSFNLSGSFYGEGVAYAWQVWPTRRAQQREIRRMDLSYEERLKAQIEQYADTINMHDLPEIFHVWSQNYLGPGLQHVFGTSSIDEAYALAYIEARSKDLEPSGRILSIGCGDGSVEMRIARLLLARGVSDFIFVCADLSPILLKRLQDSVSQTELGPHFQVIEADLNRIDLSGDFDMIMANQALHHIADLELMFDFVHQHLKTTGLFATCDMIGRNGHMRWAEAVAVINAFWPILRTEQRYHAQIKRYSDRFIDHDCSGEGFEGIRAQDILPALVERFHPYKFFGAGGFIDLLTDRGYGHGFNASETDDVAFVRFLADLNEILLDTGVIKPTWMMGYFSKEYRGEIFYRDRRALNSIRNRDGDPEWTRFYRDAKL